MINKLTIGIISDNISKEVTKFYAKNLGHGPRETRVYILEDMVIVRLKGKLLPIEEKLIEGNEGISMVKDIREKLHEILTINLGKIVNQITKRTVVSSHSDISTKTGEMIEVYILDKNYESELNKKSDW
jgi:uncharacterized protein YbcI